ncbi:MAG: LysM peptidoglycan-binding domain-containing protein [Myxococcota bacterium]|nr:LysM peptidoglycan-binding domain-containing protein [Myxococcota bacterium]
MHAAQQIPFNELPRGNGESGAIRELTELLETQGYDAATRLYDEALCMAREGHLGRARDRLNVLLCLNPDDAQAHLLLAKIYGAQKRWQEAIAELDATTACGLRPPQGLKEAFENQRDAKLQDNRSEQVAARVGAEVRALREEARRLRVDKTRLERAVRDSNKKARSWSLTAVLTTALSVGLLLSFLGKGLQEDETPMLAMAETPSDPIHTEAVLEDNEIPVGETPEALVNLEEPTEAPNVAPVPNPVDTMPPVEIIRETPKTAETAKTYVVQSGDNLSSIAYSMYGKSSQWEAIRDANVNLLGSGDSLQVGMELRIPEL